MPLIILLLVN